MIELNEFEFPAKDYCRLMFRHMMQHSYWTMAYLADHSAEFGEPDGRYEKYEE